MKQRRIATLILAGLILFMFARQMWIAHRCCGGPLQEIVTSPGTEALLYSGAAYTGMDLRDNWWRLVTSMFVHGGIVHLAFNLIALVQLGSLLESLFGARPVLLSFFLGGIAASLGTLILESPDGTLYVGASAGVFAIAGTLLIGLRKLRKTHAGEWSRRLSSRLLGCVALNLVLGLGVSAATTMLGLGFVIANMAHIFGFVTGIAIGFLPMRGPGFDPVVTVRDAGPHDG